MEDPNLEQSGSGEELENLELEPEVSPEGTDLPEPGGDPLDDIQDLVARDLAKKHRAIARRTEKKPEPIEMKSPPPPAPSEFLTKADFFKSNERKAIREITADAEIKANWSEIIPFYTPRRGKETAEDIKEDIQDAITLYRARNPVAPEKDSSATDLTATPVVKTGGGPVDKTTPKPKDPPNFNLPKQPSEWYIPAVKK